MPDSIGVSCFKGKWAPSNIFLLKCEGILYPGERNAVGSCQPSKAEDL